MDQIRSLQELVTELRYNKLYTAQKGLKGKNIKGSQLMLDPMNNRILNGI